MQSDWSELDVREKVLRLDIPYKEQWWQKRLQINRATVDCLFVGECHNRNICMSGGLEKNWRRITVPMHAIQG